TGAVSSTMVVHSFARSVALEGCSTRVPPPLVIASTKPTTCPHVCPQVVHQCRCREPHWTELSGKHEISTDGDQMCGTRATTRGRKRNPLRTRGTTTSPQVSGTTEWRLSSVLPACDGGGSSTGRDVVAPSLTLAARSAYRCA